MTKRNGGVAALVAIGMLLAGGIAWAQNAPREESAEEFNQRAQTQQDEYMRDWEAQRAALQDDQGQAADTTQADQEGNRDRINDYLGEYGLEMGPQTPAPPVGSSERLAGDSSADRDASPVDAEMSYEPAQAPPSASEDGTTETLLFFGLIALGIAAYMIPSIVAFSRRHRYQWPLFAFNLGAAWTGIGWIGCLVWAVWPERSAIVDPLLGDATGIDRRTP